ncbi:MAG TPA: alpha/beta hydrolase [Candidatus Bipolaricaulis anaerobius]|jgi:pimeloyl-ACP methyl ester carboxylesterase|uniref:Alpha/beta hydrolase fold protein n=1 Tax=Candidatus Bipolaricaulis anaerobius TaxID=2026885 RepID=A0A2X3MLT7_9BACT|nr:alpha/beta hydrolase [Candidatus Bipolaricaulis anaerobius]MBP7726038.1 alpha/beta hydrolase [Candidatus Bipolaricaulis sp.]MDD5763636.1 alpha/beta hydrolase [Candidatus Bipolaricaulis anaerobius]SQD93105.1 Alpha/beta hydrolase fold protein [Candidatus Bipolaricaulis anaerobius]HNR24355.1 alpha/beta hydrolase [Candidatus Bipolaricaulis anaerobius]HNS23562.1 alpha/beta hydrolase [Candidatus Bipolaricaulis anaerobius]
MATFRAKDGLELYYEEHGQGDPVVLLGGIMMSAASWALHVPVFARHVHLILLDLRDQGRSGKMDREYRLDVHVPDVVGLLDELDIPAAHLIGLSYGGQVALRVALAHPDRLLTLILANANHYIPNHLAAIGRAWEVAAQLNDGERFFELAIPFIYSADFYAKYLNALRQRQAMFKSALTKEWFEAFQRLCRSTNGFSVSTEQLAQLRMPTLLLGAEDDMITPVRLMEEMYRAIPGCEFITLPRAGHGAFLERAGEFLTTVVGFLAKHRQETLA